MTQMLTDFLPKTGKLYSGSSTLSGRTNRTQFPYFFRPNSYSRILHVKSVQNTELPYWLAALIEVWEWISNILPKFIIMDVITYPCWIKVKPC